MRQPVRAITFSTALLMLASSAAAQGAKPLRKCARDAVVSGTVCMDRYEASVWRVPDPLDANKGLVKKIQQGKATVTDLTAGGATQLGIANDNYTPCANNGLNCLDDIYAVSSAGVTPSAFLTWFQAQAACENAAKRLPSNAEWQAAVTGTPDPDLDDGVGDCNIASTFAVALTGARTDCFSTRGAFDMVGNLREWVADWVSRSTTCGAWGIDVATADDQCMAGADTGGEPGALLRGGDFSQGSAAGPFAVEAGAGPSTRSPVIGFRCAR